MPNPRVPEPVEADVESLAVAVSYKLGTPIIPAPQILKPKL